MGDTTKVTFRVWEDQGLVMVFVGNRLGLNKDIFRIYDKREDQEGVCLISALEKHTRPAKPDEYLPIVPNLELWYGKLEVVKDMTAS